MKFVFFGTPEFAAIALEELIYAGMPPVLVVCNPDQPSGRKKIITSPPTKVLAEENGISVWQPEKLDIDNAREKFSESEFAIVLTYANIIPKEVIEIFPRGIIGTHFSVLPKYRGPSPVQSAILKGDKKIAITFSLMDEKLDHGPILAQKGVEIGENENRGEIDDRLAKLSADMLVTMIPKFMAGEIIPIEQDHSQATYTKKFSTEDTYIDPEDLKSALGGDKSKAIEILRKIRAFNPEPGTYTFMNDKRTKLLEASIDGDKLVLKRIHKEGKTPVDV